jgi:hypothetical protein
MVYSNPNEKNYFDLLNHIPFIGTSGITKAKLAIVTRFLGKKRRDGLLEELIETGEIFRDIVIIDEKRCQVYWRIK